MNHERYQELASQFVDHELGPESEQELFQHLGTCTECREFLKAAWQLQADIFATKAKETLALTVSGAKAAEVVPKVQPEQVRNMIASIWRKKVPFPVTVALLVIVLAGGVALSSLWIRPPEKAAETSPEVVYVPRLPAIQVIGFYPPKNESKRHGN
jgi:anti-sigma factor RsiW